MDRGREEERRKRGRQRGRKGGGRRREKKSHPGRSVSSTVEAEILTGDVSLNT